MEALSVLEEKLSTKAALILLGCAAFAVTGIGVVVLLKKVKIRSPKPQDKAEFCFRWAEQSHGWATIRETLMGSLRWSGQRKWVARPSRKGLEGRPMRLLELEGYGAEIIGWQSHNSDSPVWQRPILMGEKCELPRFSGLILYDEQGRPLHDSPKGTTHQQPGEMAAERRTTLKDLL
ncbi:hypothetical protein MLD38_035133 [Melastoma candidum]|uniref:Uncharacterized protein n=1 Tax=Melastoma candidum TaxID=119954 RepID=A0ACB9MC74_9MYRT|nr:hypothetical protein MLD38_035133 [Melastoma candidum]